MTQPPPFAHQVIDTKALVDNPAYALFCEPGTGKSRTVVDALFVFAREKRLDRVIIVCPAAVRSVWADPSPILGEFAKWAPPDVPYTLREYTRKHALSDSAIRLQIVVTNPELIRRKARLDPLIEWAAGARTFLVVDESWQYKTPNAYQTKAIWRLSRVCGRCVILNGTPGEPRDQYSQFAILNRRILQAYNHAAFRARYCIMGGYKNKQVIGYQNLDEFYRRTAPYCVVRKLRDCVDLGAEPIRTQLEATLTPKTWGFYCELRDELIAWLSETAHVTAMQAGVKVLRLAQIANGFVGGVSETADILEGAANDPEASPRLRSGDAPGATALPPLREVGREKLDVLIDWITTRWQGAKLLIFTRFRADVERTQMELQMALPGVVVVRLYGNQSEDDREYAKHLLAPGGDATPAIVVANAASGGAGLNLAAASTAIFLANDYSARVRRQAEGRIERPGQTERITFLDVLAVGPKGQRTIDHHILMALRTKQSIETWGTQQWLRLLKDPHGLEMEFSEGPLSAGAAVG